MTNHQNPPSTKSRRPRFQRAPRGKIKSLTELDQAIFQHLENARFLSTDELCDLLAGERNRLYIQTRLTELYHDNWLDRPAAQHELQKAKGTSSIILALGEKGALHLGVPIKKNHRVNPDFFKHHHMVGTFYTRVFAACRAGLDITLASWEREPKPPAIWIPEIHRKLAQNADAQFVLHRGEEHAFFFYEAETGKVPGRRTGYEQSSFFKKIRFYTELWRKYRRDYQAGRSEFATFLVLTTIPNNKEEHLEYLLWLCREADPKGKGLGIFWFTYSELVSAKDPLRDRIWVKPSPDPDEPSPYSIL